MPNIIVENDLCTRCNTCATICLMGIIQPATEQGCPSIPNANEDRCLKCGHCEAFCPEKALVLDFLREEKLDFNSSDSEIDPNTLSLYMRKRRSIRRFKPEPVKPELIQKILEVARYAPTGGNSQTVQWLVIYQRELVKQIASLTVDWMRSIQGSPHPLAGYVPGIIKAWDMGYDVITCNAPHLVFAHLPQIEYIDDRTDAIIALTNFDIAAPAFGVGACWAGFIRMAVDSYQPLLDALALPEKRKVGYALFFGYPSYEATAIPRRNPLSVEWR